VNPVVLRRVAVLALVAGSSLSAPYRKAQLTDLEECADKSHLGDLEAAAVKPAGQNPGDRRQACG
jgi:hypothetical protein